LLLLLAAACSSDSDDPIIASEQESGGPEFSAVIVSFDLAVGESRVVFGVVDQDAMPVPGVNAEVSAYLLTEGEETRELKDTVTAEFTGWPNGLGGVFAADFDLDTGGFYGINANYISNDGRTVFAQASFKLNEEPFTPRIGSPAPVSVTYTAAEAEDISHITSSTEPDIDLYELSIHEALEQDKPLVIVFATPAFCVSSTCGPQVGELSKVKESVGDRANYIHIEVFENPHLIEGQRPTTDRVTATYDWGLPTEPWTFIVDKDGLVQVKFEQFTTAEEIEARLLELL